MYLNSMLYVYTPLNRLVGVVCLNLSSFNLNVVLFCYISVVSVSIVP